MQNEIVLPETEPETEWIGGRALRKVSPTRKHACVQAHLAKALIEWADGRGDVGTEWRFRVAPPGEARRPLVPDIAFVERDQLAGLSEAEREAPPLAPAVAVEIVSPGDAPRDLAEKTSVYLRAGSRAVAIVDPVKRIFVVHDVDHVVEFRGDDVVRHAALPGFVLSVEAFFREALGAD